MSAAAEKPRRVGRWDTAFLTGLAVVGGSYVLLIVLMLLADTAYTSPAHLWDALGSREIRYAIKLSLLSCSVTAILSVWVAVPLGYLMSRYSFRGKGVVDAVLDVPIVLPPLVIGLSLLILFHLPLGTMPMPHADDTGAVHANQPAKTTPRTLENVLSKRLGFQVTYAIPSVILAQFAVACAFSVRTMRVTFDQMSPRQEQVALTLGCSRAQAFWRVVLPEARRGIITAGTLAWARALGEFGPILVFSGATRLRTEVLSTTVFLELSVGNIEAAVAVSLLMVAAAMLVLVVVRMFGADAAHGGVS